MPELKKEFDVVIVGCGFAGLYLTELLSKTHSVCIIEKNRRIDDPLVTTGSTLLNGVDDIFTLFGISQDVILNTYDTLKMTSENNTAISPAGNFSWVLLDIPRLKKEVSQRWDPSATLLLEHEVIDILKDANKYVAVEVMDRKTNIKKNIKGKIFVDATGSHVTLASRTGMKIPKHKARCFQVDADLQKPIDAQMVSVYLGFDFCPAGYAYVFPIDKNRIRIGTCGTPSLSKKVFTSRELFDRFISHTGLQLTALDNELDLEVFTGGITKNNSDSNLIVIGDAAGHISPVIGEGIRFAFHSADIAAKLICKSLEDKDMRHLSSFHKSWKERFGCLFTISYIVQSVLARMGSKKIDMFVEKINRRTVKDPGYMFRIFATKFTITDIVRIFV